MHVGTTVDDPFHRLEHRTNKRVERMMMVDGPPGRQHSVQCVLRSETLLVIVFECIMYVDV